MITYALARAYPTYRSLLPAGFDRLHTAWPQAKINRVELFAPGPDDLSIGNVDEPGTVKLSARWFGVDPEVLVRAARTLPLFHGPLTAQPGQAIAHEYGHCLLDGLGKGAQERNRERWAAATRDPSLAPGPYALAASGDEYFSELFAALDLGVITPPQRAVLDYILGKVITQDASWEESNHPRDKDGKFSITAYHGANERFEEFDSLKIGSSTDPGYLGKGFYFSTDYNVTRSSKHAMKVDLGLSNPLVIKYPNWGASKQEMVRDKLKLPADASPEIVTKQLKKSGYDSVVLDYSPVGYLHQEIMTPDPEQISFVKHLPPAENPK